MNELNLQLKITGVLLLLLALLHIFFPKRFQWKEEFKTLTLLSRQMIYVHTFFIALLVLMNGLLCLLLADDLMMKSHLSVALAWAMLLFWSLRWICQFFVYSPALWRGKKFETSIHILFGLTWSYFIFVFIQLLIYQGQE